MASGPLAFVRDVFNLMDELRSADGQDAARAKLLALTSTCGFESFAVCRLPQPGSKVAPNMLLKKWPDAWLCYYDAQRYAGFDPVVKRCFSDTRPFEWSTLAGPGLDLRSETVMNEAAEHGLGQGISVPIVDIRGYQAVVSMAGERVVMDPDAFKALHLLSLVAFETAERLEGRPGSAGRALSPREQEVLQFSAAGMTKPQIADRLGLSLQTVMTHASAARDKLGAANTTHAVVKAIQYRQIRI